MLISKGYNANDVVCFKLVTGDEIVAKLVDEDSEKFTVNRPLTVVPSQQGLGLMQSLISGDINNNIVLSKTHVIMHSRVVTEIENHYIRTTTGIQPVKSGIIT